MIDPTANTFAYRLIRRIPDSRFGFSFMHAVSRLQGMAKPAGLEIETVAVPRRTGGGSVRTIVVRPKNAAKDLPVMVHLHGGGHVVGVPEQDLAWMKRYIDARPCVFVAPDYRRAVQAPFPAGIKDCYDALLWARDNAVRLGGRSDQIMLHGESAGGGLTAGLALMARDRGDVAVACQFPIYGMFDDREENYTACDDSVLSWTRGKNILAWKICLGDLAGRDEEVPAYAAPARAEDLAGLPPAIGYVGDQDLFHDENVSFFERLSRAGVPTEFTVINGAYHGAEIMAPDSQVGRASWDFILDAYKRAVDRYTAPQD
ncbi:alpha/beta hydrolase [Oricola sp.]|uniref:alpha/beta hydrolase n=1 Tax=Oricola sp. TaxID=1979950 RepID=UPI003BABA702